MRWQSELISMDLMTEKLELTDIGQIDRLYAELQKRGFTERQLEKIWSKNILRIVKDLL